MTTISPLVCLSARAIASSIAARAPSLNGCIFVLLPATRGTSTAKTAATTGEATTPKTTTTREAAASPTASPPRPRNDDWTSVAASRSRSLRASPHDPDEPQKDHDPEDHHCPVHLRIPGVGLAGLCSLLDFGGIASQHFGDVAHTVLHAAGKVASAEPGQNGIFNDDL